MKIKVHYPKIQSGIWCKSIFRFVLAILLLSPSFGSGLFAASLPSLADGPKRLVTGTVRDASSALPGVSVVIKGTTRGTTTNGEGKFQIDVPNDNTTLVFSFVGYGSKK